VCPTLLLILHCLYQFACLVASGDLATSRETADHNNAHFGFTFWLLISDIVVVRSGFYFDKIQEQSWKYLQKIREKVSISVREMTKREIVKQ